MGCCCWALPVGLLLLGVAVGLLLLGAAVAGRLLLLGAAVAGGLLLLGCCRWALLLGCCCWALLLLGCSVFCGKVYSLALCARRELLFFVDQCMQQCIYFF